MRHLIKTGTEAASCFNRVMANTYTRPEILFTHGKGSRMWDSNGKSYLDFCCGIAVTTLGHSHDGVTNVLRSQSEKLIHTSNLYHTAPGLELAEQLVDKSFADCVFFCNSGTEANEGAIKFARLVNPDKKKLVSFTNGFHGRTMGSLSITPNEKYQDPFRPLLPETVVGEFNNVEGLDSLINDEVCGVVVEVIQGEGGINEARGNFLKALEKKCRLHDCLLIVDEVQTGIGRTGKRFGYEHYGIEPDLMTLAKPLANGLPIGCVLMKERVGRCLSPGLHGSTFAGNPLATAVGLFVFEEIDLHLENVCLRGEQVRERLEGRVKKIKGRGLLLGIETEFESGVVVEKCLEKGLLLVGAGNNTVRILPPINVSEEEIEEGVAILSKVLDELRLG